jgi:hypothetical protein
MKKKINLTPTLSYPSKAGHSRGEGVKEKQEEK